MADALVEAGFLVSFALPVAFRSAEGAREAAGALPVGSFLVETDAPYLGPDRERTNEPTTVLRVTAELARIRGVEPAELVAPMREAYDGLFPPRPQPPVVDEVAEERGSRLAGYVVGVLAGLVVLGVAVYFLVFAS
jgi:hypothetical protein